MHRWTRLTSQKWEDAWVERLRFLGEGKVAMITWPDSRALKVEAYCDETTAKALVKRFGGRATKLAPHIWTGDTNAPRAPLSIRGVLKVFPDKAAWVQHRQSHPRTAGIFIPAGMAFGTGEHATTATCLRMLVDTIKSLPTCWRALDLGTGSGILAIAASTLGATEVDAIDYDPNAVRVARRNVRENRLRNITVTEGNACALTARKAFDVVLANLFSDVLIAAAPRIARAVTPGGTAIFSGVLASQARDVADAFECAGLGTPRIIPRGKWCAGISEKPS